MPSTVQLVGLANEIPPRDDPYLTKGADFPDSLLKT